MRKRQATAITTPTDTSQLQLLAVPEVAKLLSVGCTTVYALIKAKELETVKIGNSRRVPLTAVYQYIEKLKQAS